MFFQKDRLFPLVLLFLFSNPVPAASVQAQKTNHGIPAFSPPCGIEVIKSGKGDWKQHRFFPEPPERVKEVLLDVMQAVGAKIKKSKDSGFEARRLPDHVNQGSLTKEKLIVSWEPGEEAGVKGTHLKVETKKSKFIGRFILKNWSGTVLDEVACLLKTLSPTDPVQASRSLSSKSAQEMAGHEIILPANTQIYVRLRPYLSSKRVKEGDPIVFEASEDVAVNSEVVIRKGALCLGKISSKKGPKSYGREAEIGVQIETIMTVDGQMIRLREETESVGKSTRMQVVGSIIATGSPIFAAFVKGQHVGVRAGTEFSTLVDGNWTIKAEN